MLSDRSDGNQIPISLQLLIKRTAFALLFAALLPLSSLSAQESSRYPWSLK